MTSFNSALTSDQYNALRGTASIAPSHRAALYLSLCPNTVVYSARINQASFTKSIASFVYDGGSGTLDDVRVGMTMLISHTNDPAAAFFAGRVRSAPSSYVIYVNETSAPLADNDYVFILDDYRIWDKLARYASNAELVDYDVTFRQLLPRIYGIKSAYAVVVPTGDSASFDLSPSAAAATDGASMSSYSWEVSDGTITAGSDTTLAITVEFPAGFRWIHLTITDSGGRSSTRHIPVWVHDDTFPPTLLDIGDLEVTGSLEEGYHGSVTAFAGISDMLDNTLVVAWLDGERYNETLTTIVDNITLLGRLRNESSQTTYQDAQQNAETRFEIEGPLQQLARLEISSQEIDNKASPTKFLQVKTLTLWREIHLILTEFSTFHELHSLDFGDTSNIFREAAIATQAGNILEVVNALAAGINAALQINAAGEAEVVRHGSMIPTAERDDLVTVASWTQTDILGITLGRSHVRTVGRVDASGGSYKSANGKVTVATSLAPGVAQDHPDGAQRLDSQILAADQALAASETELNERAGHALAKAQEAEELTVQHPDGYWWLTPSANQWYTFTLDGSETARGIVLDSSTRWMLVSTTIIHELAMGTRSVETVYRRETSGAPGQAIRIPPQSNTPLTLPDFPPLDNFPAFGNGDFFIGDDLLPAPLAGSLAANIRHDGNTVMVWSSTGIWIANDFLSQLTPTWVEVTPNLQPGQAIIDVHFTGGSPPGAIAVVQGTVDDSGTWEHVFDFTQDSGGFLREPVDSGSGFLLYGKWLGGQGWQTEIKDRGDGHLQCRLGVTLPVAVSTVTYFKMTYAASRGDNLAGTYAVSVHDVSFGGPSLVGEGDFSNTSGTDVVQTYIDGTMSKLCLLGYIDSSTNAVPHAFATISRLEIHGTGVNPFEGAQLYTTTNIFSALPDWQPSTKIPTTINYLVFGNTFDDVYLVAQGDNQVYYSADGGISFSDPIDLGTAATGLTGFDHQRIGAVSLGGADGEVRIATTEDGGYADYTAYGDDALPTVIFIPRYKLADGSNNGAGVSDPDYLTASASSDVAGHSVWKVTSGGTVITNITPIDGGGNHGFASGPRCIAVPWVAAAYKDYLAVLIFSGSHCLAVSIDGGSTWVVSGALDASANMVVTRRTDLLRKQLWVPNGANVAYCSDYKVSPLLLSTRFGPSGETILGIEVLP